MSDQHIATGLRRLSTYITLPECSQYGQLAVELYAILAEIQCCGESYMRTCCLNYILGELDALSYSATGLDFSALCMVDFEQNCFAEMRGKTK